MMKRLLDLTAAALGLVLLSPVLLPVAILIWLQDHHSPFYIASRTGRRERPFRRRELQVSGVFARLDLLMPVLV